MDEEKTEDDGNKQKLKLKLIYNKIELIKKAKKEIALIRKKWKGKKRRTQKSKKTYNKVKRYSDKKGIITEKVDDTLQFQNIRKYWAWKL